MGTIRYLSWNMKNLSTNSIARYYFSLSNQANQLCMTAYVNTVLSNNIDVFAVLEVTVVTGEQALVALLPGLPGYTKIITDNKNYRTRKGEFSAVIYKTGTLSDGVSQFNAAGVTESNFLQQAPSGDCFINRVPVLFKLPFLAPANKTLQVISWHAPQPKHADANSDLSVFAQVLTDMCAKKLVDENQPLVFSGDFNFTTEPSLNPAWNTYIYNSPNAYLGQFKGIANGLPTTLIRKDPTTYARGNAFEPVCFDDLLANDYDNILLNTKAISINQVNPIDGVLNHIFKYVAGEQPLINFYNPATGVNELTALIIGGNRISDHCAVWVSFSF